MPDDALLSAQMTHLGIYSYSVQEYLKGMAGSKSKMRDQVLISEAVRSMDARLDGSDRNKDLECRFTRYTMTKDAIVIPDPDRKANHSIAGFGFR